MTTSEAAELFAPGAVVLLTTRTGRGALRTRPVTLLTGPSALAPLVLTARDAGKASQVAADGRTSLAGATSDGWFAAECSAHLTTESDLLARALASSGLPDDTRGLVGIVLRPARLRRWRVGSATAWDNEVEELLARPSSMDV